MTKQVVTGAGRWLLSLGVLACCALSIAPATAQVTPEMRALYERIDRLQRDLTTVQQQLYSTRPVNGVIGGGPVGGPAGIAAAGDPSLAAQFDVRLASLEEQIRHLTGELEETSNGLAQVRQRLDRLVSDVDYRLSALEHPGQAVDAPAADASLAPLPPGAPPLGAPPPPPGAAPETPGGLAPGPRNLGTVAPRNVPPPPPPATVAAVAAAALPAGQSAKQQYDYAFGLATKHDWPGAEAGFKLLLKEHPKDSLADNAEFWLGQIYLQQKNYPDAVNQFLSAYKRNPKGQKAPDAMVGLGKSFEGLNKKPEACAAFAQFSKEFPKASAPLKRSANEEKQRLSCG